jgi:innexin
MDKILGVIGGVPQAKLRNDDDFADRLSYRYTSAIFVLFAIVVSTKQYVGEPISCWVPAHFTGNHEEYANNYCWIRNTYYLPYEEYIPKEHESDKRNNIPYYQWIPIILLVQALLFYMPILFWRGLNSHSGIDVSNIVESGETFTNTEMIETRDKTLNLMTKQMDR